MEAAGVTTAIHTIYMDKHAMDAEPAPICCENTWIIGMSSMPTTILLQILVRTHAMTTMVMVKTSGLCPSNTGVKICFNNTVIPVASSVRAFPMVNAEPTISTTDQIIYLETIVLKLTSGFLSTWIRQHTVMIKTGIAFCVSFNSCCRAPSGKREGASTQMIKKSRAKLKLFWRRFMGGSGFLSKRLASICFSGVTSGLSTKRMSRTMAASAVSEIAAAVTI